MKHKTYWAVVWTPNGRKLYGVPARDAVVCVELEEPVAQVKCKCHRKRRHNVDALAFFSTKKEALAYRDGNEDFAVVRTQVIFSVNV